MASIRPVTAGDLPGLARLAAPLQADPASHVVYLAVDADPILAELVDTTWSDAGVVLDDDDGLPVAWLIGDVDEDLGRVWWLGPFVSPAAGDRFETADRLLAVARGRLPTAVTQEELGVDARATDIVEWAQGHGFVRAVGSDVLVLDAPLAGPGPGVVREIDEGDHVAVAALHDELFPGTHTPGRRLVAGHDDTHRRLVLDVDGDVAGYVAVELQPEGEGYIDFVGVAPHARRRGLGSTLVRAGVAELRRLGAGRIGLSVREDAPGARELYVSLGFTYERTAVPLRLGFPSP